MLDAIVRLRGAALRLHARFNRPAAPLCSDCRGSGVDHWQHRCAPCGGRGIRAQFDLLVAAVHVAWLFGAAFLLVGATLAIAP